MAGCDALRSLTWLQEPEGGEKARAMPRFTVHIRDEWLAVPCRDTKNTVLWLGQEALKRYMKNKPDNGGIKAVKDLRFVVRRCQSLGLLDADDTIEDALEDNDFVELGRLGNLYLCEMQMLTCLVTVIRGRT